MKRLFTVLCAVMLVAVLSVPVFAMSPPWVLYYKEVEALFGKDPDVAVDYDEEENEIVMLVEDSEKADAISQLLPTEKDFGNVTLKIKVIPANGSNETKADLIAKAFDGNPVLDNIYTATGVMTQDYNYVIFTNEVVQYWSDNLGDANGLTSTLYQEIAKDVLGEEFGIFYCTKPGDPVLEIPLGEWP